MPDSSAEPMLDHLSNRELRDLLLRGWYTHDAMWLSHAVTECGIATANRLNRQAVRSMAVIEAKRLLALLGLERVEDVATLDRFLGAGHELFVGDLLRLTRKWEPDGTRLHLEVTDCFAYRGVSRLGLIDRYECGIYERVYAWLDALGIAYTVEPDVVHCTLHHDGMCARTITVDLAVS